MKKILILLTLVVTGFSLAQDAINFTPANDGAVFSPANGNGTCNGFIIDSGGQGGPGYGNGEDITITICPDTPDEIITATFNLFDLANTAACNTGTAQNPVYDYMTIYDGDNTGEQTLGTYTGNELANTVVQATTLNTTGCLTFRFTSNALCGGQFTASVTCTTPCSNPVAGGVIVNGDAVDSIAACIGEDIDFAELGSYGQPGFNIVSYLWDFRDGTTASTQNATHSFDQAGEYRVQLFVTDDNTNTPDGQPCVNLNLIDLQVLVAPIPTFEGFPNDTTLCIGENVDFEATPSVWPVTWNGFPGTNSVDDGCLYDTLLGVAQTIPLFQSGFSPGATLDDINDIEGICIDMEHSFMGDLVLQVKCPNGTTITLHQQGGGGTQIGEPDPADEVDCANGTGQGVPYNYCFDVASTDTWVEWVNAQGGFGLTLPAGNYEPVDPLSGLLGCPLNGVWEMIVTDNWGADDGTIFGFGLNFNPALYPPVTEFTPQIGNLSDSSTWDMGGSFITSITPDGNIINVTPTTAGTYTYNFSVTDDFGCSNDSTVTLIVNPEIIVDAGDDVTVCNGEQASIGPEIPQCGTDGGPFVICYDNNADDIYTYCPDNPGDGLTFMTFLINTGATEGGFDDITIYDGINTAAPVLAGPLDGDLSGMSWTATNPTGCITVRITSDGSVSCGSGSAAYELIGEVTCGGATGIEYLWSPDNGVLDDVTSLNPTATAAGSQTFTLTAYPTGHPLCAVSDDMELSMGNTPDAGTDGTLNICSDGAPVDLFNSLGGTPEAGHTWQDPAGNPIAMPYDPATYVEGIYTYVADDGGCIATSTVTVTEYTVTPVANNTASNCGTDCTGQIGLAPTDGFGAYEYSIDNGANWQASASFDNLCTGDYTITIRDDLGCMATIDQTIDTINIPEIDRPNLLSSINNVTCNSADDGSITIPFVNAVNFSIDGGLTTQTSPTFNNLTPGNYNIVIDNGFGCDDKNVVFVITEPLPITIENISDDQVVCVDGPVWVTVGAQGGAPGANGSPEYIYEWTENGAVISADREFSWHNAPDGGATYCVTVSEACGSPVATECFDVTNHVVINPNFSIDPHDGCFPVEASFYNLSNDAGSIAKIDWDFGDGSVQSVLAPFNAFPGANVSHSYNEEGVYDVSMKITSVNGCVSDTVFIDTVRAYGYPNANFSNDPSSPTMYDANTTYIDNSSPDVVTWEWDFGTMAKPSTSTLQNPGEVVYPDAVFGTYTTSLVVTNEHGCTDTVEYDVIVQSEVLIYAPNSFTPDGDVYNEEWKVHLNGIDVYDFDLFIYNRWGETVWESHDASVGWDGKYGGKIVPDGTYIWIIRTKDLENDEKYTWNGTITVLR